MTQEGGFDLQAAWLRRFTSDTENNMHAFATRLREAMPDAVTVRESKGFFVRASKIVGVTVELGQTRYSLDVAGGRLTASVAMVVRGITLSTKPIDPAEWFAHLAEETRKASENAKALSQSLSSFMAS